MNNLNKPLGGRRRLWRLAAGVVVTSACLLAAFWGVEIDKVASSLFKAYYRTIPVFLAFLFFFYWLKAIRWQLLLRPLKSLKVSEVTSPMMIGFMGNNVLPARAGELIRVGVLSRKFSLPATAAFSSVLLERVLDMLVIVMLLTLGLSATGHSPEWATSGIIVALAITVPLGLLLVWCTFWTQHAVGVTGKLTRLLPSRVSEKLNGLVESATLGLQSIRNPRLAFWIAVTSLAQWLVMGAMVYVSLRAFGIQLSPVASFLVVGVSALGVALPSVPGFFGVIQLCFWVSLQGFGVSRADALAASVYFQLLQYIPVTLLGLYYVNKDGLTMRTITRVDARSSLEVEA